jgi:hypothetical protein
MVDPLEYALNDRIDRKYAYGILSPTAYRRATSTQGGSGLLINLDNWIHILHIWGVNFESTSTRDYRAMIDAGGINNLANFYSVRMIEMFAIIKQSIIETVKYMRIKEPGKTKLACWIPGIGLGNFFNAFGDDDNDPRKVVCRREFYRALNILFQHSDQQLESGGIVIELIYYAYPKWEHIYDNVANIYTHDIPSTVPDKSPTNPHPDTKLNPRRRTSVGGGGVLNFDDLSKGSENTYTMIINAWDPLTFIGNGGVRDGSLDGWMVGGAPGGIIPRGFACSAWLSNLHMIPDLADHMIPVITSKI